MLVLRTEIAIPHLSTSEIHFIVKLHVMRIVFVGTRIIMHNKLVVANNTIIINNTRKS